MQILKKQGWEIIRSIDDLRKLDDEDKLRQWEYIISKMVRNSEDKRILLPGYCAVCDKDVDFLLDDMFSTSRGVNFRERLVCPECGLNNRQRALVWLLKTILKSDDRIYIYEQVTSFYKVLRSHFNNLVGSEYFGESYFSGTIMPNGIRHENALKLSFEDESFDSLISQDVFEHVSNIDHALSESYRVLRKGGRIFISIPFNMGMKNTIKRANLDNGEIVHLLQPAYHGNPMDPENGSLVFYDYGWDFISMLKKARFSDAYIIRIYSPHKGNVAPQGIFFFVAEK